MTDPYMHQPQYDAGWPACPPRPATPQERGFGALAIFCVIWIVFSCGRRAEPSAARLRDGYERFGSAHT